MSIEKEIQKISHMNKSIFSNLLENTNKTKFLSNYQEVKIIGSGAFGVVLKAIHILDGKTYALKCIPLEIDKENISKRTSEIKLLSRLEHPNIVKYYYSWLELIPKSCYHLPKGDLENALVNLGDETCNSGMICLQMEIMDNNLNYCIREKKKLDKLFVIKNIIEGLLYLHSMNIIHCDIKPANILLSNNRVKISDFGISTLNGLNWVDYRYYGTCIYKPPEMNDICYSPDFSTDIYSLGILIYELYSNFNTEMERIDRLTKFRKNKSSNISLLDQMINDNPLMRTSLTEVNELITKKSDLLII